MKSMSIWGLISIKTLFKGKRSSKGKIHFWSLRGDDKREHKTREKEERGEKEMKILKNI